MSRIPFHVDPNCQRGTVYLVSTEAGVITQGAKLYIHICDAPPIRDRIRRTKKGWSWRETCPECKKSLRVRGPNKP